MAGSLARQLEALYREVGFKAEFSYIPRTPADRALLADALDSGEEGDKTDPEFLKVPVYIRTRDESDQAETNRTDEAITIRMSGANTYVPMVGDKVDIYGTSYRITKVDPRRLFGEVSKYTLVGVA